MIINGLGFSNKPLSLTPLFFKNCPLSLLFHEGVKADDFNRFKLGRVLDRCSDYGTELFFSEISSDVCYQEKVDTRFNNLDTTSFTVSGSYLSKAGEDIVEVTYGHSKAHRPDLKQVMLEMMISQDGGIPLIGKALDGNASDNTVFKERSEKLIESFKESEEIHYVIADCKLYTKKNAVNLQKLNFITRIPSNIKHVSTIVDQAISGPEDWEILTDGRKMKTFNVEHYEIKQRWHVISSETSRQQAIKRINKHVTNESEAIEKQLLHLQAKRFYCADDATLAAQNLAKKWKRHAIGNINIAEHASYESKGRPKKDQKPSKITYQVIVTAEQDRNKINRLKEKEGHYIVGSNTDQEKLSDQEVVQAYKDQNKVEGRFRFLKDPLFFASSLFVKKPNRIMALLMVMLLSLLVYGIAERRMRTSLKEQKETLPNQINQATKTPTLRWVFQLLTGINYLKISTEKQTHRLIEGLTSLRKKIVSLFGSTVAKIYQFSYG